MKSEPSSELQTRVQRSVLGDVTFAVCNVERSHAIEARIVKKRNPSDKILVSALKQTSWSSKNDENARPSDQTTAASSSSTTSGVVVKKKQVQFRAGAAVARASVPKFCVCDPQKSTPLVVCEQCSEWHLTTCCNVSGDTENLSNIKAVCLPCRQQQILTKLLEKLRKASPPSQAQAQAVCAKLRVLLPLNPTHDDAIVHLSVFLLKAPELRVSVCSQETTMDEVVVQLETCGVKRGQQGQLDLLSDLSFTTLKQACKACGLDANGSKSEVVSRFHSFLTGVAAPAFPLESAPSRKRAKTKPRESPGAAPKFNSRLAAKRSRMLQAFKVSELKRECKSRDLSTSGTREEIISRLVEHLGSQGNGKHKEGCECDVCDLDNAMVLASIKVPEFRT